MKSNFSKAQHVSRSHSTCSCSSCKIFGPPSRTSLLQFSCPLWSRIRMRFQKIHRSSHADLTFSGNSSSIRTMKTPFGRVNSKISSRVFRNRQQSWSLSLRSILRKLSMYASPLWSWTTLVLLEVSTQLLTFCSEGFADSFLATSSKQQWHKISTLKREARRRSLKTNRERRLKKEIVLCLRVEEIQSSKESQSWWTAT